MRSNDQFFIFSAEHFTKSAAENAVATATVEEFCDLNEIPFHKVVGAYKGTLEESFIVPAKYEQDVLKLAKRYNQHSVLFVDALSRAHLVYLDGRFETLPGKFQKVEDVKDLEAFTYDDVNKTYWAVV